MLGLGMEETTQTHASAGAVTPRSPGPPRDPGLIPNYELLEFVSTGGFGDVWLARERVTDMRRAFKVLFKDDPARAARDIEGVKRYQQCAHSHPNLLQILTVGETEQCFYYVMEAADNALSGTVGRYEPVTLRTRMREIGRFDGRSALRMIARLTSGVERLHRQGLAHYDLKPENVLIVEGEPKIADVGLVGRLADAPPRAGTAAYMSPPGEPSDVYALGKILYELISGRPASEFPRIPPELMAESSPELTAALRIANRACHSDQGTRVGCIEDFSHAVHTSLSVVPGLAGRWRRLTPGRKLLAGATLLVGTLGLVLLGLELYGRRPPVPTSVHEVSLTTPPAWRRVLPRRRIVPDTEGHPYAYFSGSRISAPGRYLYSLPQSAENLVVDFHLRFTRPWGVLDLGVCDGEDFRGASMVKFTGQPDGLGLRTMLELRGPGDEVIERAQPILGHPQPGLEYVARLAQCPDGLVLALWPLSRVPALPIVRRLNARESPAAPGAILLDAWSGDVRARVDLLAAHVRSYSAPLRAVEVLDEYPEALRRGAAKDVRPADVPGLVPDNARPLGNLLDDPFHPYRSEAWMSIGNWSWWHRPDDQGEWRVVKCIPFSTAEREHRRDPEVYAGVQMLRFDRARYGDFQADLLIKLADPHDGGARAYDPFVTSSHRGSVGLAFRFQDKPDGDCAWGGAYVAALAVRPGTSSGPDAAFSRSRGFMLGRMDGFSISEETGEKSWNVSESDVCQRDELFAPGGFRLTVRAVGPKFELFLNDWPEPILVARDPDSDYFREGRIALFASRLIATFESLKIKPLESK
jgi:serine/threonine protein kinase